MHENNPTLIVPFTIHSSGNRSMSAQFRLEVSLHGRAWCRIDADMPWASEAVGDIISRLPESAGYRVKIYVATEERRIVESGPEGVRLLAREPIFQSLQGEG